MSSFYRCMIPGFLLTACILLPQILAAQEVDNATSDSAAETPRLDPVPPPPREELEAAIERGIDFLLADQNDDGSWGSATRTKGLNIYAPIPGAHQAFRNAVTAMCISALIETGSDRADVRESIERGEEWLMEHLPSVRRATGDAIYNVWTHGYSIQALVRMDARDPDNLERHEQIKSLIAQQFDKLDHYESVDGGWGYYDFRYQTAQPSSSSISFVNAAILIGFHEAKQAGFDPPEHLVERAIAAIHRQQLPDFAYLYGEYLKDVPRMGINRPGGSLGRSQACNAALRLWGDEEITDEVLRNWLDRLFARNGWLDIGRKRPIPHESWMQVAGYFYYFGHYYAGYCIEILPEEERPEFQSHLSHIILDRQEANGSWWDYPFYDYHEPYGTSYALMTLVRCRIAE